MVSVDVEKYVFDNSAEIESGLSVDGLRAEAGSYKKVIDRKAYHTKLEFEWEYHEEHGDNWMSFGYNQDLVIVFDDGSRYAFEDYFTEEAFSYMFEVYESFVKDYEDLLGVVTTY